MKRLKKGKCALAAMILVSLVALGLLWGAGIQFYILLAMGMAFTMLIGIFVLGVLLPELRYEQKLKALIAHKNWRNIPKDDVEFDSIRIIAEECFQESERQHSIKMLDRQAQINALQSQINPHFLYNTLESIRGQALTDGAEEIARMAEALGGFFRYSISQKGNLVTLRDEINNIKNYFLIQEYRFSNRFQLTVQMDDETVYDYYLPKLTIQPIVENAIFHGLEITGEQGEVVINIISTKQRLLITVSDNGVGMDTDTTERLNRKTHGEECGEDISYSEGTGIALSNVHKRIQLFFGNKYGIHIYSTINRGTDVEIALPVMRQNNLIEQAVEQ